jgi:hypothetical protein
MGCNCNQAKTPSVVPTLVFDDGKTRQFETQPEALAAQVKLGGALRWMPKEPTGS